MQCQACERGSIGFVSCGGSKTGCLLRREFAPGSSDRGPLLKTSSCTFAILGRAAGGGGHAWVRRCSRPGHGHTTGRGRWQQRHRVRHVWRTAAETGAYSPSLQRGGALSPSVCLCVHIIIARILLFLHSPQFAGRSPSASVCLSVHARLELNEAGQGPVRPRDAVHAVCAETLVLLPHLTGGEGKARRK